MKPDDLKPKDKAFIACNDRQYADWQRQVIKYTSIGEVMAKGIYMNR